MQFIQVYSLYKFTVYTSLQFIQVYSLCNFTVYTILQFIQVYSLCNFTVYASLQFMQVYSSCKCTVHASLQFVQVYSSCKFTVHASLQFMQVYSLCKFTVYASLQFIQSTECWTCLKDELEGITEKFFLLRKQGKRSRKKHLSKEAIRKIAHKPMLWRVYKYTGNVEDYTNYKEALNLATTEIGTSKRSFENKLAGNVKNDRKSFYAYVKGKFEIRSDHWNSGNIISNGFQMAEILNEYFS